MAEELRPAQVPGRTFRTVFRGYDPEEVSAHLTSLSSRISELESERGRLQARLLEVEGRDLKAEFETVAREVGAVLEAAREAAESMRERAAADAARWRSEAMAEAESELRRARQDSQALRTDAWTTADHLLEQVRVEAEVQQDRARKEALRIQGEAEREAHRLTTTSRRESEDLVRSSRMEAERIALEAKKEHDELIERARRQADAAQERARALENRRDELMQEIESVRASLTAVESELEDRRDRVGLSEEGTVKVVRPAQYEDIGESDWDLGESIRIIPARQAPHPADEATAPAAREPFTGDLDEPSSTVRLVRAAPAPAGPPAAEPAPPEGDQAPTVQQEEQPVAVEEPEEAVVEDVEEPAPVVEVEQPEAEPALPAPEARLPDQPASELDALFASLRGPTDSDGEGQPVPVAVEEAPAAPAPSVVLEEVPEEPAPDIDAFEDRDELLLPITNRALRGIKRQLTDAQNEALDEIRSRGGEWEPSVDDTRARLRPDLVVLMTESFGAGHTMAESMVGESLPRPQAPQRDETEDLARDLVAALVQALEEGVAAESGPRELGAGVSRVFRAWRTDEAERRVRDLALHAYHEGIVATLAGRDEPLRWLVAGRGCASCRAAAEQPVSDPVPPLHPGCGCTVVV